MKVVVVSDNHGRLEPIEKILELHRDADLFIHCGDSEFPPDFLQGYVCVRGNNDYYCGFPDQKIIEMGGHRMLIVHGHHHLYLGRLDVLQSKAIRQGCDFVFYGHTHIFSVQERDGVVMINPGALSRNRDGTPPSYAVVTIDEDGYKVERIDWQY